MYCGRCGKQLADGAAFCPKCGAQTGQPGGAVQMHNDELSESRGSSDSLPAPSSPPLASNASVPAPVTETAKKGQSSKIILLVVLGAVALLAVLLFSNVHTCGQCGNLFFGQAYYDALRGTDHLMCENCATSYYGDPLYLSFRK